MRIASCVRVRSRTSEPDGSEEPVVKIRCRTCLTALSRAGSCSGGTGPKRAPTRRRVALARLIRCAAVVSGTSRPAAI